MISFILVLLFGLILIYMFMFFIINKWQKNIQKQKNIRKSTISTSRQIMDKIQTNNTYPRLLEIFTRLDSNVEQHKMKLNINFKGYFKNE